MSTETLSPTLFHAVLFIWNICTKRYYFILKADWKVAKIWCFRLQLGICGSLKRALIHIQLCPVGWVPPKQTRHDFNYSDLSEAAEIEAIFFSLSIITRFTFPTETSAAGIYLHIHVYFCISWPPNKFHPALPHSSMFWGIHLLVYSLISFTPLQNKQGYLCKQEAGSSEIEMFD